MKVQYIGEGATTVQTEDKSSVKTKVVNGEIIEVSPKIAKNLKGRGFQIVEGVEVTAIDDGKSSVTIEVKKRKK